MNKLVYSIVLAALAAAAPAHAMTGTPEVCEPVAPVVTDASFAAPSPGDLLSQGGVQYLEGGVIDVTLTMPRCVDVEYVSKNGVVLPQTTGGIDTPNNWYEVTYNGATETEHIFGFRLHMSHLGQGAAAQIEVGLVSFADSAAGTYSFTTADVADVGASHDIIITEQELVNSFVIGTYGNYGDFGLAIEYDADGEEIARTYQPTYSDLVMDLTPAGVHVEFDTYLSLEYFCDPHIFIDADFHIEKDPVGSVQIVWDSYPNLDWDVAWYCDPVEDIVLGTLGAFDYLVPWVDLDPTVGPENRFAEMVEERLTSSVPNDCGGFPCSSFIRSIETTDDAVYVEINHPVATVQIDVPYQHARLDVGTSYGLPLGADQRVMIDASGIAQACGSAQGDDGTTCPTLPVTPKGLINWDHPPVPYPWDSGPVPVYWEERAEARAELYGLWRDDTQLPSPVRPVGALLARASNGQLFDTRTTCALQVPPGDQQSVSLGPNDHGATNGAPLGRGAYRVTFGFQNNSTSEIAIDAIPGCPTVWD